jgi:hypothetical protein
MPPRIEENYLRHRCGYLEISAVVLTAILHWILHGIGYLGLFVFIAGIFWLSYIVIRIVRERRILFQWGFRIDNLSIAFRIPSVFFLGTMTGMLIYAYYRGSLTITRHMLYALALYPLWGLVQQFLIQVLIVNNLIEICKSEKRVIPILIGILAFTTVHYPEWLLMLGSFFIGIIFIVHYIRIKNLLPLGLYHGWLGVFFYAWILGKDPWQEVFDHLVMK